jgi:TonB family protein
MLLERTPELEETRADRARPWFIAVAAFSFLILLFFLNPDFLGSGLKRVVRLEGNDYDTIQMTELQLPPALPVRPSEPPAKPLVAPPPVERPPTVEAPPPPPPPPPPPTHVITPDDVLAPGARPDGQTQASRGSTSEPMRQGGGVSSETASPPAAAPPPSPPKPAANSAPVNPAPTPGILNGLNIPNLAQQLNKNMDQAIKNQTRGGLGGPTMGAKTGRADAPNGQNFSADGGYQILSDTKGYDFGSYMNQVLNRVRSNWLIPTAAEFGKRGLVVIDFVIQKNGDVFNCHIISVSGDSTLDGAAKASIDKSNPFQKLPPGFSGDELVLRFAFYYNMQVQ